MTRVSSRWLRRTVSSALRSGATTAGYRFVFRAASSAARALYETWSAPLRDFYAPAAVASARMTARVARRRFSRARTARKRRSARSPRPDVEAEIVHWSRGSAALRAFDAYVLPGGFAYEDRVRAGAVAAHDG